MAVNPKSLANLSRAGGSKPRYGEAKKRRQVSVSDKNWQKCREIIKKDTGLALSELLERIGMGEYKVVKVEKS